MGRADAILCFFAGIPPRNILGIAVSQRDSVLYATLLRGAKLNAQSAEFAAEAGLRDNDGRDLLELAMPMAKLP